jgi:hypothetical protein
MIIQFHNTAKQKKNIILYCDSNGKCIEKGKSHPNTRPHSHKHKEILLSNQKLAFSQKAQKKNES